MVFEMQKVLDIFGLGRGTREEHEWERDGGWTVPGPRYRDQQVTTFVCRNEGCCLEKDDGDVLVPNTQYFVEEERVSDPPGCPMVNPNNGL